MDVTVVFKNGSRICNSSSSPMNHSDLDRLTRILDISGTAYQIVIGDGWNAVQIKFDKDGKVCKR